MEDLSLEAADRSPEGVVLREAPLTKDAYVLCFKSLVCLDVIGIEVLDSTEQGVEALGGLKRAQQLREWRLRCYFIQDVFPFLNLLRGDVSSSHRLSH